MERMKIYRFIAVLAIALMPITSLYAMVADTKAGDTPIAGVAAAHQLTEDEQFALNERLAEMMLSDRCGVSSVEKIIKMGADVNYRDERQQESALTLAAFFGKTDKVAHLLSYNNIEVNTKNDKGQTPLLLAAKEGRTEIVRMLLERNACPDTVDRDGYAVLTAALFSPNWNLCSDIVQMLLERLTQDKQAIDMILRQLYPWKFGVWASSAQEANGKLENVPAQAVSTPVQDTLEYFHVPVIRQHQGDCGLHALANAESINACVRENKPISSFSVKSYQPTFHAQAARSISSIATNAGRDVYNDGLTSLDLMVAAKQIFGMDNCCVVSFLYSHLCSTAAQPIEHLERGIPDCFGGMANNASIHRMIDDLKAKDSGAVHFMCDINVDSGQTWGFLAGHWVLVSIIKDGRCKKPYYMTYMDSNNVPLVDNRNALKCVEFVRDTYGVGLFNN